MDNVSKSRFDSTRNLYGEQGFASLQGAHILVVGIGGVGSWAVEALARAGIGEITLVDMDEICVTNINRQIHALDTTIGQSKVDLMQQRVHLINPECKVNAINDFFTASTAEKILCPEKPFSYVFDAIDSLKNKCLLISLCKEKNIPIITAGGAGGKKEMSKIQICDLARSYDDALLFRVRKKLRNDYGFTRSPKRKFKVDCVFSPELVVKQTTCETGQRMTCDNGLGTAAFVTSSFGLHAAGHIINSLVKQGKEE